MIGDTGKLFKPRYPKTCVLRDFAVKDPLHNGFGEILTNVINNRSYRSTTVHILCFASIVPHHDIR